jgi:hypothetical protein
VKKSITIRVSKAAYEKLLQLAELHGTQTETIAFALENLWQKEIGQCLRICFELRKEG